MRSRTSIGALATLSFFTTITGCSGAQPAGAPTPQMQPAPAPATPMGPPIEGDPKPPAPTPKYAGNYAVVTPLDLTQNGVLPGVLGPMLSALAELHDHPGKALLDIVAAANIPTVSDAVAGLPSFAKDLLGSLLDTLIQKELYANVPIAEQITSIVSGIASLANTIDLHATLHVQAPASDGTTQIDAQVTDVGFTLLQKAQLISFDANEKLLAHATLTGKLTPRPNAPIADADLTLSGGKMTLPFGELLLQAAGPLVFAPFGGATDLKGALTNLVPCHDAAQGISDDLGGLLSPQLVETMCTAALGVLADGVTSQIDALTLDNVSIGDGSATLLDVSLDHPQVDYQADQLELGKWTWSFAVSGTTLAVPGTFAGPRVP